MDKEKAMALHGQGYGYNRIADMMGEKRETVRSCIERELARQAKSTELTDPPEALSLWGQVDRQIMDDAPVVPTANEVIDAFTSTRVGNVQTTPVVPMLLGQMWVQ